jgi:predicted phage terminase large subunit-like protein
MLAALLAMTLAAASPPVIWQPNAGPQTRFLASKANEVLYGGAAGGGKSAGLIALPLRWVRHGNFKTIVLRRDTTQLGDLLSKADAIYPQFGARPRRDGASVTWQFPSGASVWFTHCQHVDDVARFDGFEFQLVEFDELPHFAEEQYRKIRARIRSTSSELPRYSRSTANPPEKAEGLWVFRRFGAWLDPDYSVEGLPPRVDENGKKLPPALPGQVLSFLTDESSDRETVVPPGTPLALSRVFIPASLKDNPHLGPEYEAQLRDLDPVRRAQLLRGDWLVRPSAGAFFQRGWFEFVDARPAEVLMRVRRWDLAATKPSATNKDPDWTRGVLMAKLRDGRVVVEDVASLRGSPREVENLIKATAKLDGPKVHIRLPQDPASAGKAVLASYISMLSGYIVGGEPETGDKVDRARPVSAQVEAGNVLLVTAPWNQEFIAELEAFPEGGHDDQVDATSGAFTYLSSGTGAARLRAAYGPQNT